MREIRIHFNQRAPGPVACGDEDLIVEYYRTGRIDGFVAAAAPRECEIYFAGRRVDREESTSRGIRLAAREHEHPALAVNHRRHRRSVAWSPFLACAPCFAPRRFLQRHDAWTSWRTHVQNQQAAFDKRS